MPSRDICTFPASSSRRVTRRPPSINTLYLQHAGITASSTIKAICLQRWQPNRRCRKCNDLVGGVKISPSCGTEPDGAFNLSFLERINQFLVKRSLAKPFGKQCRPVGCGESGPHVTLMAILLANYYPHFSPTFYHCQSRVNELRP